MIVKKYSPEQKNSIETFGKSVLVSAAAGSGKTTILVERFLHAITEKKIEPGRILAITFTEKAANEMKSRLVEKCRERGLYDLRRSLETAYISTIHGFCSRLLRENPIEAGLDPFFQILNEGEAEVLMNRVLDKIFENESENDEWLGILSVYGEEAVRSQVRAFYEAGRAMEFPKDPVRDLSKLERDVRAKILSELKGLSVFLEKEAESVAAAGLKDAAVKILSIFENDRLKGWDAIHAVMDAQGDLHRRIKKAKERVESIRVLLEDWLALKAEELSAPVKREFLKICSKFGEAYDGEKRRIASYDFDDLLYLAWRLLSGGAQKQKAVRERYRKLFLSVLVDEYQDTSPLQDRIIGLLSGEDNLFAVGDVQQSIYRFRYADPEVFEGRLSRAERSAGSERVRLNDNYRSRGEILDLVNRLFGSFFEGKFFEPLKARRQFALKNPSCVEILCVPRGGEDNVDLEHARILEARNIARLIRERVEGGREVEESGAARPLRFGDIAILLRSTTSSYLYEKELRDLGVPYYAAKSEGFYEKPEVMDLLNLLKLLEDPALDIPLAGVLRSPLVPISDDALFWLARKAKAVVRDRPLYDAFSVPGRIGEISPEDRAKLEKFKDLFESLRKNKNRLSLTRILERALFETNYEAKLLTHPGGLQAAANVRKLVEMARSASAKGILGIDDFIRFVRAVSEREVSEPEAKIQNPLRDSVTILTIHSAKGLEFPFVIIADMGGEPKRNQAEIFLSSTSMGLGMKVRSPETRAFLQDFTFRRVSLEKKEKERAEEDRLFYVAMTRAKEQIVLSGSAPLDKKTGHFRENASWMSRVMGLLGPADPAVRYLEISADPILEKIKTRKAFSEFSMSDVAERLRAQKKEHDEKEDVTVTDLLLAASPRQKNEIVSEETKEDPEEAGDLMPRNEYGTLFHKIMELLAVSRPRKISKSFLSGYLDRGLSDAQRTEMEESVLAFWGGSWGAALREATHCYPELPFIYKTPYGILKGQIDLVFRDKKGDWTILDYKTNRIRPEEKDLTAGGYEFQLCLYALIFRKLYGEAPRRGVLYFSALAGSSEFAYKEEDFERFEARLGEAYEKILAS